MTEPKASPIETKAQLFVMPFLDEFKERLLVGRKTATTRSKRYGKPGDLFTAFGATFRLKRVSPLSLNDIAGIYYWEEGFEHPHDFIEVWKHIHPRKGWTPDEMRFLHEFERVTP